MPTTIPATEPKEEVTEAEAGASFFTGVAFIAAVLTAFFVYMATGNYWWAAAAFFGLVALAGIGFAAANVISIPAEKFALQMQKEQGSLGFALVDVPAKPPGPEEPPSQPPLKH